MPSTANNQELKACFTEQSFYLDYEIAPAKSWFAIDKELARELYDRYLDNHNKMLFRLGFFDSSQKLSVSMSFLHNIAACYIKRLSHTENIEFTREDTVITPTDDETAEILRSVPFVVGLEFINAAWINNIYLSLSQVFANEIQAYTGTVEEFLLEQNSRINMVGRVFFHLVENKSEEYPFAFLATYSTARAGEKKASHTPLKNALLEYQNQDNKLLQLLTTVSKAAQKSDLISEFVESGELFSPLKLTSNEAYIFLQEIPLYEECGILCRIPDWWKKKSNSLKLSIQLGNREPSQVGMDALLDFDARLFLGEDEISEEEIRDLLTQSSGLLLIKGKWVEVDQQKLQLTLEAYQNAKKLAGTCDYTIAEAMRLQLNAREALGIKGDAVAIEVSHGKWLQNVAARMANPALINDLALSGDFRTSLRGYQQKGLDWLYYMKQLGFGACLADDMGLGKTVQIIALLEYLRVNSDERALLIIPASLMGNWQKEIEKFAPMLKYKAIYNSKEKYDLENRDGTNLYITTYGMAVRMEELKTLHWDLLILDEAQAIKNPGTKQSKAVKQLPAKAKIALTGTPVENSLSDLWSLFDFLNAGLLGTVKEFKDFAQKLKGASSPDYSQLRAVINPFILRRLKTDKTIIADLPNKIEIKAYANLSKKQMVLYNSLVKELAKSLVDAEGIARKGLVLSSIMKFKQICNHPDQYLAQNAYQPQYSGKFERLQDICETIYEKRERVLVFTQFREMTEPIAGFLQTIFNRAGLILQGGTPVKKRQELVDKFCGEEYVPFMVLSLKAGGVGLNLTAANHVIHFDRWWNPAVENQATDRAFRIGQQKNVMAHKLITAGTIEEKIDMMIEAKSQLVGELIASSGENWITELDNQQLMELFTLAQVGDK